MGLRLSRGVGLFAAMLSAGALRAETVRVRYPEGLVHGFLTLRSLDGAILAEGDQIQFLHEGRVTSRLLLKFRDGSVNDETVVFTQDKVFRLVSDRLIQKGPSFPNPVDLSIDATTGMVAARYTDDGKPKSVEEKMDLPPDLANGLVLTLIKNLDSKTPLTTVSMIAASPKPRLVNLAISPAGETSFKVGTSRRQSVHFVVHIEIGGVAGAVAPIVGKQPPDT
ncbi:MAG TPA: hypothetical protein VGH97_05890, partial [Thermoanaerobaculia bacterium]